jgi:hypothetical protein
MALVELLLTPLPAHVRTARLVGRRRCARAGLDDELVDELRLAVGEACSRAVGLHARHNPDTPVRVTVTDEPTRLTVTVTDAGPAAGPAPDDVPAGCSRPAARTTSWSTRTSRWPCWRSGGRRGHLAGRGRHDRHHVVGRWPLDAAPGATAVSR